MLRIHYFFPRNIRTPQYIKLSNDGAYLQLLLIAVMFVLLLASVAWHQSQTTIATLLHVSYVSMYFYCCVISNPKKNVHFQRIPPNCTPGSPANKKVTSAEPNASEPAWYSNPTFQIILNTSFPVSCSCTAYTYTNVCDSMMLFSSG